MESCKVAVSLLVISIGLCNLTSCTESTAKERVKRRFAALSQGNGVSVGPTGPNLVMSCDINEDGYQQDDALVLNLRFAETSNDVLQSLKQQQQEISDQVKEIKRLFKQTHKEQAKLLSIQRAIREQNAQMTALYSNVLTQQDKPILSPALENPVRRSDDDARSDVLRRPESRVSRTSNDPVTSSMININESHGGENLMVQSRSLRMHSGRNIQNAHEPVGLISDPVVHVEKSSERDDDQPTCRRCGDDEYCSIEESSAQCFPCTECGPGYEMTAPCSQFRDISCADKNECITSGVDNTCGQPGAQCVNTPGGYLCVGGDASCLDDYYFNRRASQCEPCTPCPSDQHIIVPCSKFSDSVCRVEDVEQLSDVWTGALRKPNKFLKSIRDLGGGLSLPFSDISPHNQTVVEVVKSKRRSRDQMASSSLHKETENVMKLLQHGILWIEYNMAILHSCRSFIQVSLMMSNADHSSSNGGAVLGRTRARIIQNDPAYRSLAATRLEHTSGDRYKFVSISAVAEVRPKHHIKVNFKSAHSDCVTNPTSSDRYGLRSIAVNSKSGPFSVLWLSHDTGAVAFRATLKTRNVFSDLHAEFHQEYASDLQVVQMSSDGRYFEFRERGIILAKYHQALYSIGDSCVEEGYTTSCIVKRRKGESEGETLVRSHKSGVTYTDTAVSLTFMTAVDNGDKLALDITVPTRCQVRYMSDPNLGVVNLLWVPQHSGATMLARLNHREEIVGSVRSKVLTFVETQNTDSTKLSLHSAAYFEFKVAGRVHIHYSTRLIHSCDYVKLALHYTGNAAGSPKSVEIAQQVLGDTNGHWDGISIGTSYTVERGSMCYATITCLRGRVSRMSYGEWSTMSIIWISL